MARGRFIAFEGGEGSGKSTQAKRLAAAVDAGGVQLPGTGVPTLAEACALLVPAHVALSVELKTDPAWTDEEVELFTAIVAGVLAIVLSLVLSSRRRTTAGYSARRVSHTDPATGSRVDDVDVDPGV